MSACLVKRVVQGRSFFRRLGGESDRAPHTSYIWGVPGIDEGIGLWRTPSSPTGKEPVPIRAARLETTRLGVP